MYTSVWYMKHDDLKLCSRHGVFNGHILRFLVVKMPDPDQAAHNYINLDLQRCFEALLFFLVIS